MLTVRYGLRKGNRRPRGPDPASSLREAAEGTGRGRRPGEGAAGFAAGGVAAPQGARGRGPRERAARWHAADLPGGSPGAGRAAPLPRLVLGRDARGVQEGGGAWRRLRRSA